MKKKKTYRSSPEALMAREHASFTPWKVDLFLLKDLLSEITSTTLFVRAPNPAMAMHAARRIWAYYTKEKNLPRGQEYPEWPKLEDRTEIMCLADEDYLEVWRIAQGYPRYWVGHEDNPVGFHFDQEKRISGADRY